MKSFTSPRRSKGYEFYVPLTRKHFHNKKSTVYCIANKGFFLQKIFILMEKRIIKGKRQFQTKNFKSQKSTKKKKTTIKVKTFTQNLLCLLKKYNRKFFLPDHNRHFPLHGTLEHYSTVFWNNYHTRRTK